MMDNEKALLRQFVQSHDALAFRELVEEHKNMVFAACRRVLGNQADAEDAAQLCFLKLAETADRLKAPIAGWLHTVAVRLSIDILRSEKARKARERAVATRDVVTTEARWAAVEPDVDAALESMPERLRLPIVLYFLEARTQEQVGAALGVSRRTVATRLNRGIEVLRRRLKRAGIVAPAVALTAMLTANTAEAAPAALTVTLGKVALAGAGEAQAAAATGGTLVALKTAAVLVVGAAAGAGALAIHQATKPPHPTPLAAAPVVKKAPLTTETVLNAELTLPPGGMELYDLRKLVKEQLGVDVAFHKREMERFVFLKPGKQRVRDVLAEIERAVPLTSEVLRVDKDRVAICFWQKEDANTKVLLAEMMKLAVSDDVLERSTGARWLEFAGGRDALVQLLKMLSDPETRVRYFAAMALADAWSGFGADAVSSVAPVGTGLVLAKAIDMEAAAAPGTWHPTGRQMLRVTRCLRDPAVLPFLKKQLENAGKDNPDGHSYRVDEVCEIVADIGGPEAEAILLAALDRLPKEDARDVMRSLGVLGTDAAIARLSKQFDVEMGKGKEGRTYYVTKALSSSKNPAAARVLIRILNRPDIVQPQPYERRGLVPGGPHWEVVSLVRQLARFDTPEAQAACLKAIKATTLPEARFEMACAAAKIPAVQKLLFDELGQGGAVARRAAMALAPTRDPRLVPVLIDVLGMDAKTLRAEGLMTGHKDVRWDAAQTLGHIGGPEAEKMLIALAREGAGKAAVTLAEMNRQLLCGAAISALAYNSAPEARRVIRAGLLDPEVFAPDNAAKALTIRPTPGDLDALLAAARMKGVKKPHGAVAAMWNAVASIGGERAARELMAEVARGDTRAAYALIFSPDRHCAKAVRDVLAGNDARLRGVLVSGLLNTYGSAASLGACYVAGEIATRLPGATAKQKIEMARLLGWTQDPRVTEPLGKLLVNAGESAKVRDAAVRGLFFRGGMVGATCDPAAVEPMRHAYKHDKNKNVRRRAEIALGHWRALPAAEPKGPRPPRKPLPKNPPDEREFPPPAP